MKHRPPWIIAPRILLLSLAVTFGITAFQTTKYRDGVIPLPYTWAVFASVAAVSSLMGVLFTPTPRLMSWGERHEHVRRFLRILEWRGWYQSAGAFAVLACILRGAALGWASLFQDDGVVDQQLAIGRVIGAFTWVTVGLFVLAAWVAVIVPWHVRARRWGS